MRIPSVVIQHLVTNERMMYPYMPTDDNYQHIPREFKLSEDQTPTNVLYPAYQTMNWAATDKDPLNLYKDYDWK
jgi:hypothetical protein